MEVLERGQHLEDVRERLVDRERVVGAVVVAHPLLEDLLERLAADVLHDDVAGALVGHEVVDLDDQRVLDLGEELLLGDGRGERVGVTGVEQALEHHPAVGDVAVLGEVDPAEAAVRDRADHLVLAADEVAGPAASGVNENSWPHWGQKPSVRPGWPSMLRPIGLPHLEQVRLSSGTCGSGLIALLASTGGAGGTTVRPAPRRAARTRWEPERVRRVEVVPVDAASREPIAADCTRLAEVATEAPPPDSGWASWATERAPPASRTRRSSRRGSSRCSRAGCTSRRRRTDGAAAAAAAARGSRARRPSRRRRSSRRRWCRCSRAGCTSCGLLRVVEPGLVGADELAADGHRGGLAGQHLARPPLAVGEVRAGRRGPATGPWRRRRRAGRGAGCARPARRRTSARRG